jgi:hypothetical protein
VNLFKQTWLRQVCEDNHPLRKGGFFFLVCVYLFFLPII